MDSEWTHKVAGFFTETYADRWEDRAILSCIGAQLILHRHLNPQDSLDEFQTDLLWLGTCRVQYVVIAIHRSLINKCIFICINCFFYHFDCTVMVFDWSSINTWSINTLFDFAKNYHDLFCSQSYTRDEDYISHDKKTYELSYSSTNYQIYRIFHLSLFQDRHSRMFKIDILRFAFRSTDLWKYNITGRVHAHLRKWNTGSSMTL